MHNWQTADVTTLKPASIISVPSELKEHTSEYPNDDIGLVVDENNAVQLIFIQTQQMKETFAKFLRCYY